MSPLRFVRVLGILLVPGLLALAPAAQADEPCSFPLGLFCPCTTFPRTRKPHIFWHKVCSKPISSPCELEHYGYYPTCWHPWPFPPDYSHCCFPPPGAAAGAAATGQAPVMPRADGEELPAPRKDATPGMLPGT
jgi:hypothetical protein